MNLFLVRLSLTINMNEYPCEFHSSDAFFTFEEAEAFMKKSIEVDLYDFIKHSSPCNPDDMKTVENHPNIHYLFEIISKSSYQDKFNNSIGDAELDILIEQFRSECLDNKSFYNRLLDKSECNVDHYDIFGNPTYSMMILNYHCDRPWGRLNLL